MGMVCSPQAFVMQIAVATDVTIRGGVDTYVLAFMMALRRAGHEAVLLLERDTASPLASDVSGLGFKVCRLPLYRRWHAHETVATACRSALDAIGPDGVHVVTGSPRSCLILRSVAVEQRVPLIITESQIGPDMRLSDAERSAVRASYLGARAVVYVSAGNRDISANAIGLDAVRSVVVPNGVDVTELESLRRTTPYPRTPARLACVARLSPEKSVDTVLRAVEQLPREMVSEVGVFGEGALRDVLIGQADDLGVSDRVRWHGWVPDVAQRLCDHDMFVLPSLAEGMPYALLEAMAVGLPVVATDIPGNTEVLLGGRLGRLAPPGDPAGLAAAIRGSLIDRELTASMVRAAYGRVRAHHDRTAAMDATVRLWTEDLSSLRGRKT